MHRFRLRVSLIGLCAGFEIVGTRWKTGSGRFSLRTVLLARFARMVSMLWHVDDQFLARPLRQFIVGKV